MAFLNSETINEKHKIKGKKKVLNQLHKNHVDFFIVWKLKLEDKASPVQSQPGMCVRQLIFNHLCMTTKLHKIAPSTDFGITNNF